MARSVVRPVAVASLALVLAACSGQLASRASSMEGESPSGAASPTPDPAAAFALWLDSTEPVLAARFEGTVRSGGDQLLRTYGSYRAVDYDFDMEITAASSSRLEATEQRFSNGRLYVRDGDRWYLVPSVTLAGSLYTVLSEATWEAIESKPTRLTSEDVDLVALAAGLGLSPEQVDPDQTDTVTGDVALEVSTAGMPVSMTVNIEHTVSAFSQTASTSWALTYTFAASPSGTPILKPDDVWRTHHSLANGYIWELPAEWQFSAATSYESWDTFVGLERHKITVQLLQAPAAGTPDQALDAFVQSQHSDEQWLVDSGIRAQVPGGAARYLLGSFTVRLEEVFCQEWDLVVGDYLYQVQMMTPGGDEDADSAIFMALIGEFLPLAPAGS